ncbi:MAG: T9SS type A sorting domain-containing protein, partial [Candidatus Marinimicrobia bacterium]|nr:T9SS type A sorting domain-containing protein [Candidatus Neomarinimicrobiota bacterium]
DIRLHNTLIAKNFSKNKGGALVLRASEMKLVQSTLADNNTYADSSAILFISGSAGPVLILNSILWHPGEYELEMENADVIIENSVLDGALAEIIDRGDENTFQFQNVLGSDPLLNANYSLSAGSPALNQGLTSYELGDEYLFNYDVSEYSGSAPDPGYMGAFPAILFVLEPIETSVIDHPNTYSFLNAFPNPFNPGTTLQFRLEQSGDTELNIYNIRGQLIQTLIDCNMISGNYRYKFNAADLSTGVYICQLKQNGRLLSTHKLLLVK